MILAGLIAEGRVREDTRVAEVVPQGPMAGTPVGDTTLVDLSQHYSGLPRTITGGAASL